MKKLFFTICLLFTAYLSSRAQSSILNAYIAEGLANNLSLKQENIEIEKTLKAVEIAKTNLSPRITFAPNYTLAVGGRRLEFPIGDLLNPVYSTLNALTKSTSFPQVENVSQLLAPNNFHETKVTVQYPIYNAEAKYNINLQKEFVQTEYAKKKVLEYEISHAIKLGYYQLISASEALKIYTNAKTILHESEKLNQTLLNNNIVLKDALYSAQYELIKIEQEIRNAEKNIALSKSYFNFLLNKPFDSEVLIDSNLTKTGKAILLENQYYQQLALENRPELNQIDKGINTSQAAVTLLEKSAKKPQIYLGANSGFQGFGYNIFDRQAFGILQIGLNYELYHGQEKKRKIEQAKLGKTVLEIKKEEVKNQIAMQVQQAFLEAKNAEANLETYKLGLEKSKLIVDIVSSKYKNGAAIFIELSKAQTDLIQTQLLQQVAINDYLIKYATLQKQAGILN
jgi:outer membrane protein